MAKINLNSETECRRAYINYNYYGNSMNISETDIGKIINAYKSSINTWQASVSKDENEYIVKFSLEEGKTLLMSMEIYAGSMDRAKKMCAYLKSNTGDFYKKVANIMNEGMM